MTNLQEVSFHHPLKSGYSQVNDLSMYYEEYGSGKPLVLIHGGGSTIGTTFGRVIPLFAKSHRVIAMELQAHGHTSDRGRPLSFEQDADDVAMLLTNLGVNKADIFGFSNGGSTAMLLAIRHPEKVDKLIVGSAFSKKAGAPPLFWQFIANATFADMPQQLKNAYLAINPHEKDLLVMHDRDLARIQSFQDIPDADIQRIVAKTLILAGDKDCITPEHAAELCRLIADASLMIIPGGHGEYIGEITSLKNGTATHVHTVGLIEQFLRESL